MSYNVESHVNLDDIDNETRYDIADNTELTAKILKNMLEASKKESEAQHRRFIIEMIVSIASLIVSAVAAVAAAYSVYLMSAAR